ncbi:hypothetical protein CU097_010710 [Rhizopus azygosporus]|uniref:Uncharacterized protein n=1 Tax=Rhizopus azygosporus TaxID=86630 RepID=A0A367JJL8_RHIAZ|nr:hypothetical protein CU097_010710 [Rhizopus azygosporus]
MQNTPAYGKKIDLILRYDGNIKIELSSNEWKRSKAQEDLKLKQQSKSLRTNAAVLNHLNCHYSTDIRELLAMDFIDNVGSLYMLKLTEDGVYAASLLSKPIIPKDPSNIEMFKQTLDYLLKMKRNQPIDSWIVSTNKRFSPLIACPCWSHLLGTENKSNQENRPK